MDADLIADLASKAPITVLLYTVYLSEETTIRWTDGGFVYWGGDLYQARTSYGVISESEEITDGVDSEATINALTIYPADSAAFDALSAYGAQGAVVTHHLATVDFETGLLIGEPELLLRCELDQPRLGVGSGLSLIIDCITEEARMLEPNEEQRLTDSFHKKVWGSLEKGYAFVIDLLQKVYWRDDDPDNGVSR